MSEVERLMDIMSERLERHRLPLDETWRAMLKSDPESSFTAGYVQAFEALTRAINFDEHYEVYPTEYEVGYWYACLVILGLDTTGLGRDDA
jgi:hypothetical protein